MRKTKLLRGLSAFLVIGSFVAFGIASSSEKNDDPNSLEYNEDAHKELVEGLSANGFNKSWEWETVDLTEHGIPVEIDVPVGSQIFAEDFLGDKQITIINDEFGLYMEMDKDYADEYDYELVEDNGKESLESMLSDFEVLEENDNGVMYVHTKLGETVYFGEFHYIIDGKLVSLLPLSQYNKNKALAEEIYTSINSVIEVY